MPRKKKTIKKNENMGKVNCAYLSVREEPKPNAKRVKIIEKDDAVKIDPEFTDKLWYKIEGGYVKKAFIDED